MKLISCDNCGVMLDADKLAFPVDIYDEHGGVDIAKGEYSQKHKEWISYVPCPVCKEPVFKEPT
jgi:hypothetical protein